MRIMKPGEIYKRSFDVAGSAMYLIIESANEAKAWNTATSALAADTTLANAAIAMTELLRTWSVAIPAAIPKGNYIFIPCIKAGTDPANTDDRLAPELIQISDI
jgi:hypothetical protein